MKRVSMQIVAILAVWTAVMLSPSGARAYGPEGHRLAGRIAQVRLCPQAEQAVAALAGGESLESLGLWADRIRGIARYAHSAPWHYMNIADGSALTAYRSPPEGDVLWAIERFRAQLADTRASRAQRSEALKFLAHLVVDIHQPLHVGRAADRGGNRVDLLYAQERINLHRFWDSEAVMLMGSTRLNRQAALDEFIGAQQLKTAGAFDARAWARESLALRGRVYELRAGGRLDRAYLEFARTTSTQRLALAGLRLAATINAIYCS